MLKAMEGSVFVHPDSRNLMAANDNFGRSINTDPTREVAIHHNPVTGEYVVIQGGAGSVAIIRPGGELHGPGAAGRLVSVGGVPGPGGHWIVHSRFHPNRPGQPGTALSAACRAGFAGGDFGVVHSPRWSGLRPRAWRSSAHLFQRPRDTSPTPISGSVPAIPRRRYWLI